MARTHRKIDPRNARWAKSGLAEDDSHPNWKRRCRRILVGADGAMYSDKCSNARIDDEGGYKLDTWSECPGKGGRTQPNRARRIAGKILIARQLSE